MRLSKLQPIAAIALLAAATSVACGGGKPQTEVGPPPGAKPVDAATAGSVTGRVLLDGPVPANAQIKMSSDPFCARANQGGAAFESFVSENGGLGNVFVHIKEGLGTYWVDVPKEPVKLDQHGCRYTPHVLGIRAGQPLQVSNSDDTMHNVHALATVNGAFNFGQPIKGQTNEKIFNSPEVMVTFKCDVHAWMNAYVGVVNHPYFAVTESGGRFELKNVPPGTYTIEAWHEKLGAQTQTVTLGEKESKEMSFTFKGTLNFSQKEDRHRVTHSRLSTF
jgi:Polysaccharide lyase family 4, domain II